MSSTSPKLSGIGRLRIGVENDFEDESSTLRYVKSISCDTSGLTAEPLIDEQQKMADYNLPIIVGPKTGVCTTSHYLCSYSNSTPAAAPTFDDEFGSGSGATTTGWHMIMSAIGSALGNCEGDGFAASVDDSASTTSIVKTTDGMSFRVGQPVVWETTNNGFQMGWLTGVTDGSPDELDLLQVAVEKPKAGSKLFGAFYAWQTTGDVYHQVLHDGANKVTSYTLEWLGLDDDDKVVMTGCQPTGLTLNFAVGALPIITITWGVAAWEEKSSGGLGGAAASEAWTASLPQPVTDGWVAKGTSAASTMRISSLEVDLQIERPVIADVSAVHGVGGFGPIRRKPVCKFSVFRDHSEELDDFLDQNGAIYTFRFGNTPGSMIGICCPAGMVQVLPTRQEAENAITSNVEVTATEYSGDDGSLPSDGTTAVDSDFRIGFC